MSNPESLVAVLQALSRGTQLSNTDLQRITGAPLDSGERRMLEDHGVQWQSDGVVIPGGLDVLDATRIGNMLIEAHVPASRLDLHWTIGSTNTELLERARRETIDRHVVLAEHQSAGRGRRGRDWLSPVACNLSISIGARFARMEDTGALSLCVGVALADVVAALLPATARAQLRIKWPNDLQIDGRKLSGILIESSGFANAAGVSLVIGMGINVRMPRYVGEQIDQPWIDLTTACGAAPDRNRLCADVICAVLRMLDSLARGERAEWLDRFAQYDATRDAPVTVRLPDREVAGIARGIDNAGELRVEVDGVLRTFTAGEVSLRPR